MNKLFFPTFLRIFILFATATKYLTICLREFKQFIEGKKGFFVCQIFPQFLFDQTKIQMDTNSSSGFMLQTMLYLVNHNASTLVNSVYNERFEPAANVNETRCFGVYGCFEVDGPWAKDSRPPAQ